MNLFKNITVSVLMAAIVLVAMPQRAEALLPVPVADAVAIGLKTESNVVQAEEAFINQVLNGIAWAAAKAVVQSITQSLVTWINSGFQGSPAFVTNLNVNLRQVADGVAQDFIQDLISDTGKDDMINSELGERVGESIALGFYAATSGQRLAQRLQSTLQRFTQNPNQFLYGDFSQGGWNAWYHTNASCGDNIYCFRIAAHDELIARVESQIDQRLHELEYGGGFMSWRGDCHDNAGNATSSASLSDADRQSHCKILTPGSVVESQLEHTLGSSLRQLELADSINEIIGALASQLVSQVIGSGGLLGTSDSPSGGGDSYIDSINNDSENNSSQSTALLSQIDTLKIEVQGYKNNWQKVRTAAVAAKATMDTCPDKNGNAALLTQQVEPLFAQADAAIAEADAVLPLIDQARALVSTNISQAVTQYNALRGRVSPSEVATAAANAIENPTGGDSLYLTLQGYATSACANPSNDGAP